MFFRYHEMTIIDIRNMITQLSRIIQLRNLNDRERRYPEKENKRFERQIVPFVVNGLFWNSIWGSREGMCPSQYIEEFDDTKGVIGIRISKKNRQYNGQNKKYNRTNNDLQNIYIELKIE